MHVAFIPYGIKHCVDTLFRDMQAQKFNMIMHSPDGKTTKGIMIQGSLRYLPFGVMEYVFPKENADAVMTTLKFNEPLEAKSRFPLPKMILNRIRKAISLEPVPENFNTSQKYPWIINHVNIIPLGIRKDAEGIKEPVGEWKDWTHEAI